MKTYLAEIKEVRNPTILTPTITSDGRAREELIGFWGLDGPDVDWCRLYELIEVHKVEL